MNGVEDVTQGLLSLLLSNNAWDAGLAEKSAFHSRWFNQAYEDPVYLNRLRTNNLIWCLRRLTLNVDFKLKKNTIYKDYDDNSVYRT